MIAYLSLRTSFRHRLSAELTPDLSFPLTVSDIFQKALECPEAPQNVERCVRGILGNRVHEKRPAPSSIPQKPQPEIGLLSRPPQRAPRTANEREVQNNDRVRSSKPDLNSVIGPEVAVQDPAVLVDELALHLHPPFTRRRHEAGLPEDLVQLYDMESRGLAQTPGES